MTDDQQRAEWEAIERIRDRHRPPVAAAVRRFFSEQERALVAQIKAVDFSSFFDFNKWKKRFIELLIGNILEILNDGFLSGQLRAGIGELTPEQLEARNVQFDIVARQVAKSELINNETSKDISDMLRAMIEENATQADMQRALRRRFDGYRSYRVDRIVNTVVVGAFESGTLLAWQEAGIERKAWLSTQDERVRPDHDTRRHPELAAPIHIADPFTVGGAQIQHPGDPEGPPSQIINCRCTMIPITGTDEDEALTLATISQIKPV